MLVSVNAIQDLVDRRIRCDACPSMLKWVEPKLTGITAVVNLKCDDCGAQLSLPLDEGQTRLGKRGMTTSALSVRLVHASHVAGFGLDTTNNILTCLNVKVHFESYLWDAAKYLVADGKESILCNRIAFTICRFRHLRSCDA